MKIKYSTASLILVFISCIVLIFSFKKWEKTERVIETDIHYYYGYLPAFFIYDDIKLEKSEYRYGEDLYWFWSVKTEDGEKIFKMTMGLAILYAPFFFAAHLYALCSDYSADGFSEPYKFFLLLSTIFYLLIGLDYLRKILQKFQFKDAHIAITLLVVFLATNLLAYSTLVAPMPHVYNFCLFAIFIYYSLEWFQNKSILNSIRIGLLFGLITLIRPSNFIIAFFPILYGYKDLSFSDITKRVFGIILPISFLVWIPQLLYWLYTTGDLLVYSYNDEGFDFTRPHILQGLFSFRKGWLIYTPVMIFSIAGIILLRDRLSKLRIPILAFLIANIYIVFSWWCWWYGGSIGQRSMIESYALLSIPLAALIEYISKKDNVLKIAFSATCLFFIWLNVFQIFQYNRKSLHWDAMTRKLYFAQFGKLDPIADFNKLIDPPDYKFAIDKVSIEEKKEPLFYLKAANNKYLGIDKSHNSEVVAVSTATDSLTSLRFIRHSNDECSFQTLDNFYYCPEIDKNLELTANRRDIGQWEKFKLVTIDKNKFAFKAVNNKFLSLNEKDNKIYASKDSIGPTEIFELVK